MKHYGMSFMSFTLYVITFNIDRPRIYNNVFVGSRFWPPKNLVSITMKTNGAWTTSLSYRWERTDLYCRGYFLKYFWYFPIPLNPHTALYNKTENCHRSYNQTICQSYKCQECMVGWHLLKYFISLWLLQKRKQSFDQFYLSLNIDFLLQLI